MWRLYETGDADVMTLLHTTRNELPEGADDDEDVLAAASDALLGLYELGLITVSKESWFGPRQWISLSREETYEVLSSLPDYMKRAKEVYQNWDESLAEREEIVITLTEKGQQAVIS